MNSNKFLLTSDLLTHVPSDAGKSYSLLMKQNTTLFVSTLPLCVHFHQPNGPLSFPLQRKEFVVAPFLIKNFHKIHLRMQAKNYWLYFWATLLLDRRSIDLSGAREKEGHFHYKNFLRASKWGITCHTCSIIPKSLYWGLGLSLILSKGFWGWRSRHGMWHLISKLSKSFYNESDLLFLVHHWGRLTSNLRGVRL